MFTVHAPTGETFTTRVPLTGAFNVANALCAVAALGEAGFDPSAVASALGTTDGVPGRLEQVDAGQGFLAVVDYAHKPDAVTAALTALRPLTRGRLIVVIGAGGDRDPGKRPIMGEIAARLADVLVVTDDNPRSEDPAAIRAEVLAGAEGVDAGERAEVHEVGDRRAAIALAVRAAVRRGHRRRRRQGTRDRPGGRRHRAPVRRPRRAARGAGRPMIPMTLPEIAERRGRHRRPRHAA